MRYWRRGDFYKIVFIPSRVHPGVAIPQGAPTGEKSFDLLKPYPNGVGYYPEKKFRSLEELTVFCAAVGEFDVRELPLEPTEACK